MKLSLFRERVAAIQNEPELRSYFMDVAGRLVGARAWGLDLLDSNSQVIESELYGLADTFRDRYQALGQDADSVSQWMIQHHIPVHNLSIQTPQAWQQSRLYQQLFKGYGIEHGMVGPLVANGRLIGGVYFMRGTHFSPFCDADLIRLSSLCLHLSVRLATLRIPASVANSFFRTLTRRELEIAEFVAQGLNNREISMSLGISRDGVKQALKRMFRKLGVSARAEMIAKLKS
ncbi:LuxR C-terminal-related transcriptional regulator [Leptolyngbya sp. FACHB-261]|uniref:helix-turn-helix transcriptional regulator n=1 Tax=Leptolyngbya sp. FACHB-261 TaxID=2692806 RepID=UPI0016874ECD|nr:LuxR C-terminal-related transcriptional regulator [Leptolyngbya sp. FACHB-261]MBD2100758.1 LuxR family transcriptional regulator [Leptolyngbya sp. FACHB-261]